MSSNTESTSRPTCYTPIYVAQASQGRIARTGMWVFPKVANVSDGGMPSGTFHVIRLLPGGGGRDGVLGGGGGGAPGNKKIPNTPLGLQHGEWADTLFQRQ